MSNDLRTVSILFGQITTSIIAILFLWFLGDSETAKHLFSYLWFQPLVIKILLSFLILIASMVSLYRILKMLHRDDKNDGDGRNDK